MEETSETILKVSDLSVSIEGMHIIENVGFELKRGEALAIVGPNGAGKTTLFRALMGIINYNGEISWAKDVRIGYIPQNFSIERNFPVSVRDFFSFKTDSLDDIIDSLKSVGIATGEADEYHLEHHIINRPMGRLSGGEFQRVMIAWTLIDKPNVLLVDEPTSGIDVGGEETVYKLVRKIQRERSVSVLLISHDLNIVYQFATTVLCLNKTKVCYGPPVEALNTDNLTRLYGGEAKFYEHSHIDPHV